MADNSETAAPPGEVPQTGGPAASSNENVTPPSSARNGREAEPAAGVAASLAPSKPVAEAKALTKPLPAPPLVPFRATPSIPYSMTIGIEHAGLENLGEKRFAGELEEDFSSALGRVQMTPRRRSWWTRRLRFQGDQRITHSERDSITWADSQAFQSRDGSLTSFRFRNALGLMRRAQPGSDDRHVAFDGFHSKLYDDKIERDRRYGTVYVVSEELNAYLVRLEFPRKLPDSSLRRIWQLGDEMPDYDYSIGLEHDVLSIRAGVRGEAYRRLSYISASFPSEFLTRIQFGRPVKDFKHRMRDKVLELIVFKMQDSTSAVGI